MKQFYLKVLGILVLLLPNYLAFSQNQMQRTTNPLTMAMGVANGRMIVGDFDKDGDVDILYQNGNTLGLGIGYVKNMGGGVYQDYSDANDAATPFASFSFTGENITVGSLFVFDIDNDGDVDVLDRDGSMGMWRNENGTSFTHQATPFTVPAWTLGFGRMIAGDFDIDGDQDILFQIGNAIGVNFQYLQNNGSGGFTLFNASDPGTPFTTFNFSNQQMSSLIVLDYDVDGDVDIIDRDNSSGGVLGLWKNNAGSFTYDAGPFTGLSMTGGFGRLIFGDFDADGDPDVLYQEGAVSGAGFGYASNNGSGVYTNFSNASVSTGPFNTFDFTNELLATPNMLVFDYDNDGDVDIIDRDNTLAGQLGIWRQVGTPPIRISTSPLDDATNVSHTANIILTFSETVTKGTGNIYLYNATTNLVVATLPVGDAGVTSSDNLSWTINFPGDFARNINYAVRLDAAIFKDADNMAAAAITNNTTFNFFVPPPIPPTISNLTGDAAVFTEAGTPVKLDVGGDATASDDLPDFNGATLTVSFTANAVAAQDILGIENQGVAAGQIGVSGASVTYGGITFATFTGGTSPANLVVTMNSSASYAAVTALLRALTYSNNSNNANANTRNISISITDAETAVVTVNVTASIIRVNNPPTLTVPTNFGVAEDVASPLTGIGFIDVDGGASNTAQANITVSMGTLSGTSGGGVTVTGSGTSAITLQGTRASIQTFITSLNLLYLNAPGQTTNATLSLTYNDAGDTGTGGALTANAGPVTIIVAFVNASPTITAPPSINVQEDVLASLAGYSFSDTDAGTATVDVTLSVPAGNGTLATVAGSGVAVTTVSANELMLSGSIADINAFIAANTVNFTPALNNAANVTLTIKINDRGNTGADPGTSGTATSEEATATVTITVAAVNDPPTLTVPTNFGVAEDIASPLTGIGFIDVDGGTSNTTQANITVTIGTLSGTSGGGVIVTGSGTGSITLQGTRASIQTFVTSLNLLYLNAPTQTTNATLSVTYNDAGDVGTGGPLTASAGPVPILFVTTVNDAPTITAPGSINVNEDVASFLAGYSFSDIDAGTAMVDVTLSVPSGSGNLTAAATGGITVTTVSPNELMLTGTVTNINSYITANNVGFTTAPNNASNVILTIKINDLGNTGADPGTSGTGTTEEAIATVTLLVTAVNDAPTITAPASYAVTEDAPAIMNGIIFNDADGGTSATTQATFIVTLGTLSATSGGGITVTGGGTASVTLQGTRANINAFIAAGNLQYNNALSQTTNATLSISFNDAGDIGTGGALVANAGPIPLNVTYINDAPVITAPATINLQEDLPGVLAGYSFSDIDAGTSSVNVTLTVPSGVLTAAAMAGITVTTISSNAVMISGSIANLNSYISANNIGFTTALNNVSNVILTITLNDAGNTGSDPGTSGTATSEEATTTITLLVTAINDAPVINTQLSQSTLMDITKVFNTANSNLISVSDVDAGNALIRMSLEASGGLLSLPGTTGLTFTTGDGSADAIMEFQGTLANINAALDGLSLAPPIGVLGDINITLKANDLGNSPGPALTDTKVLILHVLPSTPTVLSVSSSTPNGAYKVGDVLQVTVTFNQPVNVTGTPALTLETGATDRQVIYTSGSGTSTLTFNYTVQNGDQSADLDYASINALTIAGGSIRNGSIMDAALALPATGSANSIAGSKNLVIDGIAPFITSVNVPINKTYVAGQPLNFSLNFSEVITVNTTGGTPGITVQLESGPVQATYVSGSGSNVLLYRYVVVAGDLDNNGIALGIHALNGATLKDAAGNDALLTLNGVPATTGILVDAAAPAVTSVTVPANKIWKAGEVLNFTVNFSEPVIKVGATDPYIVLTIGTSQVQALYKNGAGTNAYLFSYTIAVGDLDRNGIAVGPSPSISLNGVTLKDAAGNDANLFLNNIGNLLNVWVDAVPPIVTAAQVFSVAENSAAATAIGIVQGTDPGSAGTLQQWTITSNVNPDGDANPAFAINAATGAITVNDAGDLNFEATSSLTISVSVSDGVNTSAVQTVVINLTNAPEPPLDIALSNNTILENNAPDAQVGLLSATSAETGTTFTYTLVAGGADNTAFKISGNSLRAVGAFDAETKTAYNIRIRATTQAGELLEKPFVITVTNVNEAPTLNAITDRPYCATPAEVVIPLAGITPGPETTQTTTVSVSSNNAALFTQLTADNTAIRLRFATGANGNVTITVTVKDNGGTANNGTEQVVRSFNIAVTSIAAPVITSNKGTKMSKGDFAALTATGGVSYVWDNSPGIISGQNSNVLNIRPQQNITYRVTASNAAGCSASAQIAIEVIDDYKVNSANIMTPNGDGINDRFIIKNIDSYPGNELKIFDRSGRLIYTKRGYQNEWDGKINGKALEEGTYYFMLDFGPGLPKVKGFITIIRDK